MTNQSSSESSIPRIAVIIGIMAICLTLVAFAVVFSPPNSKPTPTAVQPTSSPPGDYQPEIIPPPANTPAPTWTSTAAWTNTPLPTLTAIVSPTLISSYSQPLPDLIVTSISTPVCRTDYPGTVLEFAIFVRNIGRARTRPFGVFDTGVYLILGQRHYSLEEWDTAFNGVVGTSIVEIFNLNPNDDIKFTVVIDLKGNKNFGIEVVANLGENPIREADMTNNTLMKYFSANCY